MTARFAILVSNIGIVYTSNNRMEAENEYRECCEMVENHYGRASGQTVTFFMDDDIYLEYQPTGNDHD